MISDRQLGRAFRYVNSVGFPSDEDWEQVLGQVPVLLGTRRMLITQWAPYSFDGRVASGFLRWPR